MNKQAILFALWASASGALIPVMATMNGRLGKTLGSVPYSVLILFIVALFGAVLFVISTKSSLPSASMLSSIPMHYFTGGLIVLFYVVSVTFLTPRFGVANTIFFVVVAQIIAATIIDHFGFFDIDIRTVTLQRLAGICLMIAGLMLARGMPTNVTP